MTQVRDFCWAERVYSVLLTFVVKGLLSPTYSITDCMLIICVITLSRSSFSLIHSVDSLCVLPRCVNTEYHVFVQLADLKWTLIHLLASDWGRDDCSATNRCCVILCCLLGFHLSFFPFTNHHTHTYTSIYSYSGWDTHVILWVTCWRLMVNDPTITQDTSHDILIMTSEVDALW